MIIFIIICIIAYVLSQIYWDQYTETVTTLKGRTKVIGWPASFSRWSLIFGGGTLVTLPFLYLMQDWKNPSLALNHEGVFINQQLIKNTFVPYSNISGIIRTPEGYKIAFKDLADILKQQSFIFKPFVKYNLENDNFYISDTHTTGNISSFFAQLEKKLYT